MKLYMFRTVRLSIIRSLSTVHLPKVCVMQVCRQLLSRTWSCSKAVYKPVWHIPLLSEHWITSWWWTDELSETRRVSWQNKFVKLVHLVGFITNKFVTIHGYMKVKLKNPLLLSFSNMSLAPVIIFWQNKRNKPKTQYINQKQARVFGTWKENKTDRITGLIYYSLAV